MATDKRVPVFDHMPRPTEQKHHIPRPPAQQPAPPPPPPKKG